MKVNILALLGVLVISSLAYADVPPQPGTKTQAQLTGEVAKILYDSLTETDQATSPEYAIPTTCGGPVTTGKTHTATTRNSSVQIVCSAYYCAGHKAVCNLIETFN